MAPPAYVDAFSQLSMFEPVFSTHYKRGNFDGTLVGSFTGQSIKNDLFIEGWLTCDSATTPTPVWPITHVFSMNGVREDDIFAGHESS